MDEKHEKKRKIKKKKEEKAKAWEAAMSNFTDDLWIEIFLRLPFKPLLRLKSVSKSWLSIISSHRFAKSYLANSAEDDDEILIVHKEFDYDYEEEDGSFSLFRLDSARISKNLNFPYSQGEYQCSIGVTSELVGSDCGIVCVVVRLLNWTAAKKNFDIYLWNPATKHSKLLPSYTTRDEHGTNGTYGFGFDHIDYDFKLVRIVSDTAEVYSSNMNVWRTIESKPISQSSSFHALHGFLFAIHHDSMMAFNLNKEVFIGGIKLPVGSLDEEESSIDITVSKDTVVAITCVLEEGKINLWTLDDETCVCGGGVEASWTKVLCVDIGVPDEFFCVLYSNFEFILIEKDGDRILYNWNTKETTDVAVRPYLERGEIFKYTKSLFSLVGSKRIMWANSYRNLRFSSDWDGGSDAGDD